MLWKKIRDTWWPEIFCILFVSGFVYLPWIKNLTYNKDDWYFLFDGLVRGPDVFGQIALHTRPIRGPLYQLYFSLFGLYPFPYHVIMYATRLLGGAGILWLVTLLWPNQRFSNLVIAVLFLLFPGFYWWVSGFEFQPYVLSLGLEVISIAFTLKSISSGFNVRGILWGTAAILSGWIYLALVEYAIGMELFRYLCVYLFLSHQSRDASMLKTIQRTLRSGAVFLIIPLGFLFWYQFLFDNWRSAQDVGTQLGQVFHSLSNALWTLVYLTESVLNVSILAWFVPFFSNAFNGTLGQIGFGFIFTLLAVGVFWLTYAVLDESPEDATQSTPSSWQNEALLVGLIGTAGGVLPVVLANRLATFDRYSHYTLPASLAGVFFLAGLLFFITSKRMRFMALSLFVGFASLTHHGLATTALNEQKTIRDFWWQVAWRAPSIRSDALLVVLYPGLEYADGEEVAWGPANFIYYPEPQSQDLPNVTLAAIRLEQEPMRNVILGNNVVVREDLVIKFNTITYNYRNVLILTQPSGISCVRALDGMSPNVSENDSTFVLAASKNSKISTILPDAVAAVPPAYVFGREPAHTWCYYYQKAELARQTRNWDEIIRLEKEAKRDGFAPEDTVEWMPFLLAHAVLEHGEDVMQLGKKLKKDEFYERQACANVRALTEQGITLQPEMRTLTDRLFCQSGS